MSTALPITNTHSDVLSSGNTKQFLYSVQNESLLQIGIKISNRSDGVVLRGNVDMPWVWNGPLSLCSREIQYLKSGHLFLSLCVELIL